MAEPWTSASSGLYVAKFQTQGGCCYGMRGEIDGQYGPITFEPNISDVTYLVDFLYRNGPLPSCFDEADVWPSENFGLNIEDVVYLVDYLFRGGPEPPPCPLP